MRGLVAAGVAVSCATVLAQPSSSFQDLLPALVDKIAAGITAGSQVTVTPSQTAADRDSDRLVEREIARLLAARGIRVVAVGTAAPIAIATGCGENLRERACVAEIRRGDVRDIVTSTRPHDDPVAPAGAALRSVAIEVTPLFAQRAPILDVLAVDERLFVLDPAAVTVYRRTRDEWQRVESRPIETTRTWPRDVRGRLRLIGSNLDAFLPGVVCRTSPELTHLACADQREPWPIAIDNAGLDALRNTFHTPEGTPFFSAAALDPASGARAVVVTAAHALVLMDESRTTVGTIGTADDVASVAAPCGGNGAYVLTTSAAPGARTDTLELSRVDGRKATPAATPVGLPGRVTALWSPAGAAAATVVVRDPNIERHEAFQVRLSCVR